jgi:hypothetical protein
VSILLILSKCFFLWLPEGQAPTDYNILIKGNVAVHREKGMKKEEKRKIKGTKSMYDFSLSIP